jgi:hypothetical protein
MHGAKRVKCKDISLPIKGCRFLEKLSCYQLITIDSVSLNKLSMYTFSFLCMLCVNCLNINAETKGYSNNIYDDCMVDELTIRLHPVKPNGLVESNII